MFAQRSSSCSFSQTDQEQEQDREQEKKCLLSTANTLAWPNETTPPRCSSPRQSAAH
jgi:hypothetical protein